MTQREEVERWLAVARRYIDAAEAVDGVQTPGNRALSAFRVAAIDWQNLLQHGIGVFTFVELCEAWLAANKTEASQQQLIETAPKDGSEILAFMRGRWYVSHWENAPTGRNATPFWRSYELSIQASRKHQPTHWMPLPEAPK